MADDIGATGKGNVVALDEAMARWHAEADEDDLQLGLFAEPQTEAGKAKALTYRRGPGRPPGARNKRTERTAGFLLARHRDPREILLEIAEANVHDLAALLGCTPMEAAQEKRLAATAVLPYLASKLPLEVDVTKKSVVYLTIVEGHAQQASREGGGIAMNVTLLDAEAYAPAEDDDDGEAAIVSALISPIREQ